MTVGPDLTWNGRATPSSPRSGRRHRSRLLRLHWGIGCRLRHRHRRGRRGHAYVTGGTDSTEANFPVAVGPDLTFNGAERRLRRQGELADLVFTDGFESGDISAWTALIADLADLFNLRFFWPGHLWRVRGLRVLFPDRQLQRSGPVVHQSNGGLGDSHRDGD